MNTDDSKWLHYVFGLDHKSLIKSRNYSDSFCCLLSNTYVLKKLVKLILKWPKIATLFGIIRLLKRFTFRYRNKRAHLNWPDLVPKYQNESWIISKKNSIKLFAQAKYNGSMVEQAIPPSIPEFKSCLFLFKVRSPLSDTLGNK